MSNASSAPTTGDFARMDRANDRAYEEMMRTGGDFARADGAGYRSAPYVPPSYALGEMGSGTYGIGDYASIPAFAGAPRPAPSQELFRQSERDYRQATDTGAVIRPGDTMERLTGGNKELMGRYARGMGLTDMNQLRVGQSMRADWDMSASDALGVANSFYAADGQRKLAAAAQAATTANRIGMSAEPSAVAIPAIPNGRPAFEQIPTGGNGRGPTPRAEPSGYLAQAADWLDRFQTTEVGKILQGLPPEGFIVGGLKAGLNVLGKAESIATGLQAAEQVGTAKGLGAESANASKALASKLSALEDAEASAARVRTLSDGRVRYYEAERAARTDGPSRGSSYVTEWNPANGTVRSWNEVYDQAGNVNRVHPKMINGQTVNSLHYPPTARELGR